MVDEGTANSIGDAAITGSGSSRPHAQGVGSGGGLSASQFGDLLGGGGGAAAGEGATAAGGGGMEALALLAL
jgi:hypothetical protein